MIDLHRLRACVTQDEPIVLTVSEGREVLAELESARSLTELPLSGDAGWPLRAQQEMVAQLLLNLSAGVAGEREAQLVAGVVVQELAGLARVQVRSGGMR